MANIPIYPGSSSFQPGMTPFQFYDNDFQFQTDADKFTVFASRRLGYPLVEIELQDVNFYAAFEDAITTYGNELYAQQIQDNLLSFQGAPTTIQPGNNELPQDNLNGVMRISDQYGIEAGVGGTVTYHDGSIDLISGTQTYDMTAWAASQGIQGGIEIRRLFYEAPPAITRYFDPYSGAGAGAMPLIDGFGGASASTMNFLMMPMNFDIAKVQAIEFNDQIRKSQYSFELINNQLRIFPIPTNNSLKTLHFQYIKSDEKINPYVDRNGMDIITNVSNVPYNNPVYSQINSIGRQWIFEYGLAIVKEILGYVRGKYSSIPIPGSEITLNQGDLITASTSEKASLIERLRLYFDSTSRDKLLQKKATEAEYQNKTIAQIPMVIFVG
jgi:hypothetical protein